MARENAASVFSGANAEAPRWPRIKGGIDMPPSLSIFHFFIDNAERCRELRPLEAPMRSDEESLLTQLSIMLARDSCGGLRMTFRSVISNVPYFILMRALTGTRLSSFAIQIVNRPSPSIIRSG